MRNNETRFAELRLDKNLKQKDIANILDIPEDRYSKYERGINDISLNRCNKLANFYKVSFDYLLGISNHNSYIGDKKINLTLLCKRLLELRKEYNLSQTDLGQKVGFPQTTYSYYENGKSIPTTFKLCYIAQFYNISFDYLVGRTNTKEIQS